MRARSYDQLMISDTPLGVFDRVSLETVEKVPTIPNSTYRPQPSRSLQGSNIVLANYIKHYANNIDDSDRLLRFAMFAYNTLVYEVTELTPL